MFFAFVNELTVAKGTLNTPYSKSALLKCRGDITCRETFYPLSL